MRWRLVALISLGVNAVLAVIWLFTARSPSRNVAQQYAGPETESAGLPRTNIVVRRQFFSWREVESPDYPTYITNLRQIGCPEQTIRDIIIADINALYAMKRATNLVTSEQQWWRSDPDPAVVRASAEKAKVLEDERHSLLTKLLSPSWESGDMASLPRPSRPGVVLDGPVLGAISSESKQAIQDISVRSQERLQTYVDEQQRTGDPLDPVELARLREQTRSELQHVLSPSQLEEFLLRYSQNANNWRTEFGQLRYFNATPDEFRAVFRATDTIDQQIQLLADATDANSVTQRKTLEEQRENTLKLALGSKRYEEYQLLQDPVYRDAVAQAQQAGTPEAVRTIYEINLATASEQNRIQADTNLTASQRSIELKRVELEQLKASTLAAGQDVPPDPSTTPVPSTPQRRTHLVRAGDSPAVVALMYGLPVSALRAANPGRNLNNLRPGDSITIPPAGLPTPVP